MGTESLAFEHASQYIYAHTKSALFEVYYDASLSLYDSALFGGAGQAFSVAHNAKVKVSGSVVQGFAAGGEFFRSHTSIGESVFSEFPDDSTTLFRDLDSDGIYVVGGVFNLTHSVFGMCKDDCIDSGTGEGGQLHISSSLFDGCWHEGLALTNRGDEPKFVSVKRSTFQNSQQGIEVGWSTPKLHLTEHSEFVRNHIGYRRGDNYNAASRGYTLLKACAFYENDQHYLDFMTEITSVTRFAFSTPSTLNQMYIRVVTGKTFYLDTRKASHLPFRSTSR